MKYFSIYDKKAETFSLLSPAVNEEVYIRGLISALLANPDSPYVNYPEDFELHCLCSVDEESGFVDPYEDEDTKVAPMLLVVNRMKKLLGRSELDGEDVQD